MLLLPPPSALLLLLVVVVIIVQRRRLAPQAPHRIYCRRTPLHLNPEPVLAEDPVGTCRGVEAYGSEKGPKLPPRNQYRFSFAREGVGKEEGGPSSESANRRELGNPQSFGKLQRLREKGRAEKEGT